MMGNYQDSLVFHRKLWCFSFSVVRRIYKKKNISLVGKFNFQIFSIGNRRGGYYIYCVT